MKRVFDRNPNLRLLLVILFASGATGFLTFLDVPFNPVRGVATVISMSAAVPPTVENGGIQPPGGPGIIEGELFLPGVFEEETEQQVIQEETESAEVLQQEVGSETSEETTAQATFEVVRGHVQEFFRTFAQSNTQPTREQIEAFVAQEIDLLRDLTPEEAQEFSELIEKEVVIAQREVGNEAIANLQRALITFATLLLLGMGLFFLI